MRRTRSFPVLPFQISLIQQKRLVVSILSNSLRLPRYFKKCPKWNC